MLHETIFLREGDDTITLTTYVADHRYEKRPAMLVIPGGGYCYCSEREAEPIAIAFMAKGYNCFVLNYSVEGKAKFPRPLVDAALAMKCIRRNAEKFNIDTSRMFAVGFSAGGHLCALLGSLWDADILYKEIPDLEKGEARQTGTILAYPVISAHVRTHQVTFMRISGTTEPKVENFLPYSIDDLVSEKSAPIYVFHTATDTCVPVENSIALMMALAKKNIPFAARIYPQGQHGFALANRQTWVGQEGCLIPDAESWVDDTAAWMATVPSTEPLT
jgi:acetyl esterase/lipase